MAPLPSGERQLIPLFPGSQLSTPEKDPQEKPAKAVTWMLVAALAVFILLAAVLLTACGGNIGAAGSGSDGADVPEDQRYGGTAVVATPAGA